MKKLLALSVAGAIALGGFTYVQAHEGHGGGHKMVRKMHMGGHLKKVVEELNLTDAQKAQVQPIIDQAKPQIKAIHQEAMEKTRAVMENTSAQIRPFLTAEQQQKLDAMKAAHEKMREAMKEMHEATAD